MVRNEIELETSKRVHVRMTKVPTILLSINLVSMIIRCDFSCQIIFQKSAVLSSVGPIERGTRLYVNYINIYRLYVYMEKT